jgi:hypothetical protein
VSLGGTPLTFSISNYPNPFNPSTTITYDLAERSFVRLRVFDMLGRQVAILVDEEKSAGTHTVTFDASKLPSGVYFYRIDAGSFGKTKKIVLTK